MSEYIITHEQLKRLFDWIDKLLPMDAKRDARLDLYTSLEVEEIVRCRDCGRFDPWHTNSGEELDCGFCRLHDTETRKDKFCAWGERMDI